MPAEQRVHRDGLGPAGGGGGAGGRDAKAGGDNRRGNKDKPSAKLSEACEKQGDRRCRSDEGAGCVGAVAAQLRVAHVTACLSLDDALTIDRRRLRQRKNNDGTTLAAFLTRAQATACVHGSVMTHKVTEMLSSHMLHDAPLLPILSS